MLFEREIADVIPMRLTFQKVCAQDLGLAVFASAQKIADSVKQAGPETETDLMAAVNQAVERSNTDSLISYFVRATQFDVQTQNTLEPILRDAAEGKLPEGVTYASQWLKQSVIPDVVVCVGIENRKLSFVFGEVPSSRCEVFLTRLTMMKGAGSLKTLLKILNWDEEVIPTALAAWDRKWAEYFNSQVPWENQIRSKVTTDFSQVSVEHMRQEMKAHYDSPVLPSRCELVSYLLLEVLNELNKQMYRAALYPDWLIEKTVEEVNIMLTKN